MGKKWLVPFAIALLAVGSAHGQKLDDARFLTVIGELREATYSDKASLAQRLIQSGHPRVHDVLTMHVRPVVAGVWRRKHLRRGSL